MPKLIVLIVEDEPMLRFDAVDFVEDAGIEVIEATNADDAIVMMETHPEINVVFTDIEMPGTMNGLKLAFAVRDRWPDVSLIIASGRIRPEPAEMPSGVTFLPKPYTEASVLAAVRHAA